MGEGSDIAWCDDTVNVWIGCDKVSAGCKHCYAEVSTPARVRRAGGLEVWGPEAPRPETKAWAQNLRRWNREAATSGKVRRVFGQSLSDTFEDRADLDPLRARFFAAIETAPALTFQLLTKRPENIARMVPPSWMGIREPDRRVTDAEIDAPDGAVVDGWHRSGDMWIAPEPTGWPAHVQIGCTVEDQENAERRIPRLLAVPAPVRFLSVEPQIGPVNLSDLIRRDGFPGDSHYDALACDVSPEDDYEWHGASIAWVICGGESGSKARPFDLAWARSLRDQCAAAGVPFFLKQLGQRPIGGAVPVKLLDSHGGDENEWPADLQGCRAFP